MYQDRLVSKSMRQYGSRRLMTDSKELSFKMSRLKVAGFGPNPGSFCFMWAIKRFYIFKWLKNSHSASVHARPIHLHIACDWFCTAQQSWGDTTSTGEITVP